MINFGTCVYILMVMNFNDEIKNVIIYNYVVFDGLIKCSNRTKYLPLVFNNVWLFQVKFTNKT